MARTFPTAPGLPSSPTAATAAAAGGGALTGVVPIDLNITLPTDYERVHVNGRAAIRLKHHTDFSFLGADYDWLVTGAPGVWTLNNSGAIDSLVSNPSGYDGETHFTPGTNGASKHHYNNNSTGESVVCSIEKTVPDWTAGKTITSRMAHLNTDASESGTHAVIYKDATSFAHCDIMRTGANYVLRAGVDNANTSDNTHGADNAARKIVQEAGVYFQFIHGTVFAYNREITDDPLPPHLRTVVAPYTKMGPATGVAENLSGPSIKFRFAPNCWANAAPNVVARVLYYRDDEGPLGYKNVNCGTQTTSPAIQLVDDFDLGATTLLTDAALQTALAAAINNVTGDAATWTFTAVRNAAVGVAAGTYAAAGSATVEGSGRYFSLWGKCNSDGTQTGSIDSNFTVAFADS